MVTNFSEDGMKGTQWLHAQKKKKPQNPHQSTGEKVRKIWVQKSVGQPTHLTLGTTLTLGSWADLCESTSPPAP